jgi:hypothetical protein
MGHLRGEGWTHRFRVTMMRPDRNMPDVLSPSASEWDQSRRRTGSSAAEPKDSRYQVAGSVYFVSSDASLGSSILDMLVGQVRV